MEKNFEQVLTALLEKYENSENKEINSFLEEALADENLSDESKQKLQEVNEYIDSFAEKASSLEKAKNEGKTRKRWMIDEIARITQGRSDEEKKIVIDAISTASEQVKEELLTDTNNPEL